MIWARMLAYVTGMVNQELLLRNEYLAAENRILRGQIKGRLLLSEGEKATLAEINHRLGREALEHLASPFGVCFVLSHHITSTATTSFRRCSAMRSIVSNKCALGAKPVKRFSLETSGTLRLMSW